MRTDITPNPPVGVLPDVRSCTALYAPRTSTGAVALAGSPSRLPVVGWAVDAYCNVRPVVPFGRASDDCDAVEFNDVDGVWVVSEDGRSFPSVAEWLAHVRAEQAEQNRRNAARERARQHDAGLI